MNVLITGIGGFVGHFLTAELTQAGHVVCGFDLPEACVPPGVNCSATGSITDLCSIAAVIRKCRPDACIHLAGIASPPIGRLYPEKMLNTNILGTAHVLEALHANDAACRFLLASTAYVYGTPETDVPISEEAPLRPNGIYAVSKAAADLMTLAYSRDFRMHTMTARAANHTGPGQGTDFVVPAFARQIAAIAAGKCDPQIKVGNLNSERSFMDVRDVVRAYRLLIENGHPGKAYNVSSPERVPIRCILQTLAKLAGVKPEIEIDPDLFRETDKSPRLDTRLIAEDTGWKQDFGLETTLREILQAVSL